jgi:hypothetical protein
VLFWVVPDLVAGRWQWTLEDGGKPRRVELSLRQNYQKLEAVATLDGKPLPVERATLTGRDIELVLTLPAGGRSTFSGTRINQAIEGRLRDTAGKTAPWSAVRVEIRDAAHVIAPAPVVREFNVE